METLNFDEYNVFYISEENTEALRGLIRARGVVALPISLGNATMFHMSFIDLGYAVPWQAMYEDGSNRGLQINIDRKSSYSLPWGSIQQEPSYMMEKWGLTLSDAEALMPLFNGLLSGRT